MKSILRMFASYKSSDYQQYLDPGCGVNRPSILNQFLSDPRTTKLVDAHATKFHLAIVVRRGRILASATNKEASRTNGAATRGSQNFIHAERNLLRTIGDYGKLRGSDVYVMRIRLTGKDDEVEFKYSQPCPECTVLLTKCMREYGLKNVYFTR